MFTITHGYHRDRGCNPSKISFPQKFLLFIKKWAAVPGELGIRGTRGIWGPNRFTSPNPYKV